MLSITTKYSVTQKSPHSNVFSFEFLNFFLVENIQICDHLIVIISTDGYRSSRGVGTATAETLIGSRGTDCVAELENLCNQAKVTRQITATVRGWGCPGRNFKQI